MYKLHTTPIESAILKKRGKKPNKAHVSLRHIIYALVLRLTPFYSNKNTLHMCDKIIFTQGLNLLAFFLAVNHISQT